MCLRSQILSVFDLLIPEILKEIGSLKQLNL